MKNKGQVYRSLLATDADTVSRRLSLFQPMRKSQKQAKQGDKGARTRCMEILRSSPATDADTVSRRLSLFRTCKSQGFSLIEVTIALAIFTTAVLVLTQGMLNGLTCTQSLVPEKLDFESIAFVRKQVLATKKIKSLEDGGAVETPFHGKSKWEAEVTEADLLDLFKVTIRMEFEEPLSNNKTTFSETLYALRPSWSDPIKRKELLEERKKHLEELRGPKKSSS